MLETIVNNHCPRDWMNKNFQKYELYELPSFSMDYVNLASDICSSFSSGIKKIVRVESSYLYGQFLLKKEEYEAKGPGCIVKQLYHDTAASKIDSILTNNLDWRLANRVKFGRGVSFSPCTTYANCQSSRSNGIDRAMIVADVLIKNREYVSTSLKLPSGNNDTTVGNREKVYVKFYDDEFFPNIIEWKEFKVDIDEPVVKQEILTDNIKEECVDFIGNDDVTFNSDIIVEVKQSPMFYCYQCDYSCYDKLILTDHVFTHRYKTKNLFQCYNCGFRTNSKNALKLHALTHKRTKNRLIYMDNLKKLKYAGCKRFECKLCEYTTDYLKHLKGHFCSKHNGEWPFKCDKCDFKTHEKNKLNGHKRVHTGEKPFKCNLCEFRANRSDCLKTHMYKHSGEFPFKCESCDYKTYFKSIENADETRALRIEMNSISEMLRAFTSRLNPDKQQSYLNSLQAIEEQLRLPCETVQDFENLNKLIKETDVKVAVSRLLRRCSALTPEKTTTAMLQSIIGTNLATQYNWEGRGQKMGIKDLPITKLMQYVLQSIPKFKDTPARTFVGVTMNWLRNAKTRQKTFAAKQQN
ncbi:hypothetical protein FQR65_LT14209 [Abscondita terminalis]|nr:hypothetical protein FQR65_LT14209 [Abscondita terminalis]